MFNLLPQKSITIVKSMLVVNYASVIRLLRECYQKNYTLAVSKK